jgi:hypothetical protein
MSEIKTEHRVVMAKVIASRWIRDRLKEEYRFSVYQGGPTDIKKLPSLLRSFRDGKVKMAGVEPLPDLGIEEKFDSITIWSSNKDNLMTLQNWFDVRGVETSGMW